MKEIEWIGIGTLICVVIIIVALLFASTKAPIRDGQYMEVTLEELSANPEKFGDGYKLAVEGCPFLVKDSKSGELVNIPYPDRFPYILRESHNRVPLKICAEILILAFNKNLPCRTRIWGTLRKGEVAGKNYYVEVDGYKFQKQLAN